MKRRTFLNATSMAFLALSASGCVTRPLPNQPFSRAIGYGNLVPDPRGLLDLPNGFSYRIVSSFGDPMTDGASVPDKADGMGCFELDDGRLALVRNHELIATDDSGGEFFKGFGKKDGRYIPGGTIHVVLDAKSLEVRDQFRSLGGTLRNCSGGVTPWGSWLTCEESTAGPGEMFGAGLDRSHGWVFEVPANARSLSAPTRLSAMGRFNHEAACVDPGTGFVYLTEDRDDSVLYRFKPHVPGQLSEGGRLQAMQVVGIPDLRNWSGQQVEQAIPATVRWLDLDGVDSPKDDLRMRAAARGASLIARGEGIHMGDAEAYFCSTSGGQAGLGQIFRLALSASGEADQIALFFESVSHNQFNFGDNLTVAPNGHLIVCEDQYTARVDNHLRGITTDGYAYPLARLNLQTEMAGACFSPDGNVLFVNVYSPTKTLAITGPWDQFNAGVIDLTA
jgi:secreted PhoX family phosphatase